MKRNTWYVVGALAVVLLGWVVTGEIREKLHERALARQERERREAEVNSIRTFAASHNAIVDWQKTLCNGDTTSHLFSVDLANVLIRPDGRALMFYAELKDITHAKDGVDTAWFETHGCGGTNMKLRLSIDPETAENLQARRSEPVPYFVVAANISNVGNEVRQAASAASAETSDDSGEVIVVKGRATGALYIGADGYQFELDRGAVLTR
jgi:hypothetical protein